MRVAWISAGVSSFIAAYIAKPDKAIYIDIANQHPDSLRFLMDCQRKLDVPIEVLRDVKYGACVDNVIVDSKYINGPAGAPCTLNLKKRVRQEWERTLDEPPVYIWGYDANEENRAKRLAEASEFECEFPLIEHGLSKADCHGLLADMGIKRPYMYELGYSNNNCIGCVKGGMGYWNRIRRDFPQVFKRRAKQEREIGHSCIKGVFLDELDPERGNMDTEVMPDCSFACFGLMDGDTE
jgi:hypothetical protein